MTPKQEEKFKRKCKFCETWLEFHKTKAGRWVPNELETGKRHACPQLAAHKAEVQGKTEEEMSVIYGAANVSKRIEKLESAVDGLGAASEGLRLRLQNSEAEGREMRRLILDQKKLLDVLNAALSR